MQDVQLYWLADQLHSAAIHLLRQSRRGDPDSGLSPARLSVLSVLVYGGPASLGDLARAEQVKPPTMSRLVDGLEGAGLVTRERAGGDRRMVRVAVTGEGRALLEAARQRRIGLLTAKLAGLKQNDAEILVGAAKLLTSLFGPGSK